MVVILLLGIIRSTWISDAGGMFMEYEDRHSFLIEELLDVVRELYRIREEIGMYCDGKIALWAYENIKEVEERLEDLIEDVRVW